MRLLPADRRASTSLMFAAAFALMALGLSMLTHRMHASMAAAINRAVAPNY